VKSIVLRAVVLKKSSACSKNLFGIDFRNGEDIIYLVFNRSLTCLYNDAAIGDSVIKNLNESFFYLKKNNGLSSSYVKYDYKCKDACPCEYIFW